MSDYVDANKDPTVGDWQKAGYPGIVAAELGRVPEGADAGEVAAEVPPVTSTETSFEPGL